MRINISAVEDQFPFERVPVGVHQVPATIETDDGKVVHTHWPVELGRDGTLYYATGVIKPDGSVDDLHFWHRKPKDKR